MEEEDERRLLTSVTARRRCVWMHGVLLIVHVGGCRYRVISLLNADWLAEAS